MKMTEPRYRMLAALDGVAPYGGSLSREVLFYRTGSHSSGYRVLHALVRAGYVETSVTGSYMTGSDPTVWCRITDAGSKALRNPLKALLKPAGNDETAT